MASILYKKIYNNELLQITQKFEERIG